MRVIITQTILLIIGPLTSPTKTHTLIQMAATPTITMVTS